MTCLVQINSNDVILSLPYVKEIHQDLKLVQGSYYDSSLGYIIPIDRFEKVKEYLLDKNITIKEVEKIETKPPKEKIYYINPLNDEEFEVEFRFDKNVSDYYYYYIN